MKKILKKIWIEAIKVFRDTLQDHRGIYSRTSCTMFAALMVGLFMAIWDFFQNGFRYDVWMFIMSIGVGMKIVDAQSKKIKKNSENELPG